MAIGVIAGAGLVTALLANADHSAGAATGAVGGPGTANTGPMNTGSVAGPGAANTPAAAATRAGALVADGAWCWFQDPRAVHYVGRHDRTYIGYVSSTGNIEVTSQDTGTAALAHATLHVGLQRDDHAAPALEVLPSKQIAVFYSKHTGADMYYRISKHPEDITSFGVEHRVGVNTTGSAGYTYANPIYLSAEKRTYLFFRAANSKPAVTWSDDNLKTWARPQTVVTGSAVRPYAKFATNGVDKIVIAFDDGHPRNVSDNSVYAMNFQNGILSTTAGGQLARLGPTSQNTLLPAAPVQIGSVPPLYNGGGAEGRAWVQDIALDSNGNPVILYATYPGVGGKDHRYHYARWTGSSWQQIAFAKAGGSIDSSGDEPNYSGGMSVDPNDVSTVYASRKIGSQWELQRFHTSNGGVSFAPPVNITTGSTQKNVRPVVPHGPAGTIKVLWMSGRYVDWKGQFHTQLRELTTGPRPVTVRFSAPRQVVSGHTAVVSGRAISGYQGHTQAGVQLQLWGHSAGRADRKLAGTTTNSAGLASFRVKPARATSYDIRAVAGSSWGAARSPSTVVTPVTATAARVGVNHTTIKRGHSVVVSMRLRNAHTGHGLAGAHIQLWQKSSGGRWTFRKSVAVNSGGLAKITTRPTRSIAYQARYPGNSQYAAVSSAARTVHVTR